MNTMENTWSKFQEEIKEQSLCGACGQYYDEADQGNDGYHSPKLCDANDEITESTKRTVTAQQFADDFLLVMMNDYEAYSELMDDTKASEGVAQLSDKLREEWETLAEQVTELVTENISEIAGLLIAQLLQGQGSLPFDLIAKQLREEAN